MSIVLGYLLAARAKIADKDNWTQHVLARDVYGSEKPRNHPLADDPHWEGIDGRDTDACQWCAIGSIQAVTPVEHEHYVHKALTTVAFRLHNGHTIDMVNDDIGHAAVLACFDQAIKDAA
jgi:hypothetical protein